MSWISLQKNNEKTTSLYTYNIRQLLLQCTLVHFNQIQIVLYVVRIGIRASTTFVPTCPVIMEEVIVFEYIDYTIPGKNHSHDSTHGIWYALHSSAESYYTVEMCPLCLAFRRVLSSCGVYRRSLVFPLNSTLY